MRRSPACPPRLSPAALLAVLVGVVASLATASAAPALERPASGTAPLAGAPASGAPASGAPALRPDTAAPRPFAVRVEGRGRPMLLIPGLMSGGDVWDAFVAHFRDRYELHVLTLAGFAGVPAIDDDSLLARQRDAILAYVRDRGLARPVVVGHSLGGFLAFSLASTAPDEIGPVVAVDGVPYLMALGDTSVTVASVRDQAEVVRTMYAALTPAQLALQARAAMRTMVRDSAQAARAEGWARGSDPRTVGRVVAEMSTTDLREAVARIRTPVLLVAAGAAAPDGAARARLHARYAAQVARVPEHTVVVAPDARHFVMLDSPDFLHATVDDFLGRAERRPARRGGGR